MPLDHHLIAELNDRFEGEHPEEIVRWALSDSGLRRIAVASSFQVDATAVVDMAVRVRPDVPILFLQTGFHFAETLAFKEQLTRRLALNVVELVGDHSVETQSTAYGPRLYERDPELCCRINKVLPLARDLRERDGWMTGMRRDSAPTRAAAPIVDQYELEPGRTIVKVNPIATWTRAQVHGYLRERELPIHPLYELGYASIGCAPCTRMVFPGEDERAGRWAGNGKIECGIHLPAAAARNGDASPG